MNPPDTIIQQQLTGELNDHSSRHRKMIDAKGRPSSGAAELFLAMLAACAPRHSLLEVRYRFEKAELTRFFVSINAPSAARIITQIGQRTDVYVGCAPRARRSGGREDITPTALLWADCDGPDVIAALHAFPLPPSVILRSGTATNEHAFWPLTSTLALDELEDANRRLAFVLGADPKCIDGARILRVPGTFNFKHPTRRPVRLVRYTSARYRPTDLLGTLPPMPAAPPIKDHKPAQGLCRADDPLLNIAPVDYVRVLTHREPGPDHKIICPLHTETKPSFHIYPTADRGWTCFGCPTPTGKPLGGDIYKLASLLWGIPTSGRDFIELRDRLDHLFGVHRG
jgi:hypothetical protein